MNINFRQDRRTTRYTLICFLFIAFGLSSCAIYSNEPVSKVVSISLKNEHIFWNNWFRSNKETESPLAPFDITLTSNRLNEFDKKIEGLKKAANIVLMVRINIDNGVFQAVYYTWETASDVYSFIALNGIAEEIYSGTSLKTELHFSRIFSNTGAGQTFVDYGNRYALDEDSVYLTVKTNNKVTRYGLYNPDITNYDNLLAPVVVSKYIKLKGVNKMETNETDPEL